LSRSKAGLPPLKDDEGILIWKGIFSAAEDLDKAVRHVRDNATRYGIDPNKVAIGGHSAGAGTVVNAGFGLRSPVAAMFPMSPGIVGFDMQKVIDSDVPSTLLVTSQNDDPAISEGIPPTVEKLKAVGADYQLVWIPGFPHFYPTGAVSLADDGTRISIGERVTKFLDEKLKNR
jgi:predicted esterase